MSKLSWNDAFTYDDSAEHDVAGTDSFLKLQFALLSPGVRDVGLVWAADVAVPYAS